MKRLIPAIIILLFIIIMCFYSHILVDSICSKTLDDIENFYNKKITAQDIQNSWQNQKELLSLFVNHNFLDEISIYIGQLTVADADLKSPEFETIYKNVQTILYMIKEEQRFAPHSFY